tara:strand:+ start:118 stop:597 length:480 start_codon:yes stop_codon:yes gene_type:complete
MKKTNNPKNKNQNKTSNIIEELETYYDFMSEKNLVQLEIKTGDTEFKFVKQHQNNKLVHEKSEPINQEIEINHSQNREEVLSHKTIKSPMVGTAYLSPEPNAKTFVSTGDKVTKGQVLLIIEAMKIMNNISSPHDGTIKQILVEDSQPVEYDQPLILIE